MESVAIQIENRGYLMPVKTNWITPHGNEIWKGSSHGVNTFGMHVGTIMFFMVVDGKVGGRNMCLDTFRKRWHNYNHKHNDMYK